MDRLKHLFYKYERGLIFLSVFVFWAGVYFGIDAMPKPVAALQVPWDPVWHIPFIGAFIVLYLSAYIQPLCVFLLPYDRILFRRLSASVVAAVAISAVGFILLPLEAPRPAVVSSDPFGAIVAWLYASDVKGNLFPSLHASTAFLMALTFGQARRSWRWPMLAWASLIAVSTLFVRQHYLIDVAGGLALALLLWFVIVRPVRPR